MYEEYTVVRDRARGNFCILATRYTNSSRIAPTYRAIVRDNMTYKEATSWVDKYYTE